MVGRVIYTLRMREVRRQALVPYTPSEMDVLVNDVPRYPEFLPWCPSARILKDDGDTIEAAIEVGRPRGIRVTDLLDEVEEERWVREAEPMVPEPTDLRKRLIKPSYYCLRNR